MHHIQTSILQMYPHSHQCYLPFKLIVFFFLFSLSWLLDDVSLRSFLHVRYVIQFTYHHPPPITNHIFSMFHSLPSCFCTQLYSTHAAEWPPHVEAAMLQIGAYRAAVHIVCTYWQCASKYHESQSCVGSFHSDMWKWFLGLCFYLLLSFFFFFFYIFCFSQTCSHNDSAVIQPI